VCGGGRDEILFILYISNILLLLLYVFVLYFIYFLSFRATSHIITNKMLFSPKLFIFLIIDELTAQYRRRTKYS